MNRALKATAIVLFLTAFGWLTYQVKQAPQAAGQVRKLQRVAVGQQAPDFRLDALGGHQVSLRDQRGEIVLLDFWATWCAPCRMVTAALESFVQPHEDANLVLLSINQGETRERIERVTASPQRDSKILLDPDSNVGDLYGVRAYPTLVLVDRQGKIAWINVGYSGDLQEQLADQIDALNENPRRQ